MPEIFAISINAAIPAPAPPTPSVKKSLNLVPAISIIIDITAIITIDALKWSWKTTNTNIGGTSHKKGFIKPFQVDFKSSLWSVKYAAKNTIKPILAISDGWNDPRGPKSIHLFAPLASDPIIGTKINKPNETQYAILYKGLYLW